MGYLVIEVGCRLVVIMTTKGTRFVDPVTKFRTEPGWRMMPKCLDDREKCHKMNR